jgi:hypothetical protein
VSVITADLVTGQDTTYDHSPFRLFISDVLVLTKRSIARIRNEPETLADVTFTNAADVAAALALPCCSGTPSHGRACGWACCWPMQHPELAVICWSAGMLLVFAPLVVRLYRRKALG